MFFWRSAAVKTVKGVENTSFNKKLGETTFPYPVPISEKFLHNTACQRIMAEIAKGVSQSDAARKQQQQQQKETRKGSC